jgi:hypothetical protein
MTTKQVGDSLKELGKKYLPFEFELIDIAKTGDCQRTWVFRTTQKSIKIEFASTDLTTFLDEYMSLIIAYKYDDAYLYDDGRVVELGEPISEEEMQSMLNQD